VYSGYTYERLRRMAQRQPAIAAVLNERKIATLTGGVWYAATVIRVQKRLGLA
jgi:hypothetical protein